MKTSNEAEELFKEFIKGGLITVYDDGTVWNNLTNKEIGYITGGYKRINMFGVTFPVHRLVYLTWKGEIPEGFLVNHIDGDKLNNDKSNLELVTESDNRKHAVALGLVKVPETKLSGSKNGMAKLTESQVRGYRKLYEEKAISVAQICEEVDLLPKAVRSMLKRETYKDVI